MSAYAHGDRMKHGVLSALLFSALLLSCSQLFAQGSDNSSSGGVLVGTVSKGPMSPVVGPGSGPGVLGVAGAKVDIASIDGKPLTSVDTDSHGEYRVTLPAGTYQITLASLYGAM